MCTGDILELRNKTPVPVQCFIAVIKYVDFILRFVVFKLLDMYRTHLKVIHVQHKYKKIACILLTSCLIDKQTPLRLFINVPIRSKGA